jgi:ubiquinone/menaquinone biosynthesis C-methylase UbiE
VTVARETIDYYTECWAARLRTGHNAGSRAIHYGLDLDGDSDAAKLRTNVHVIERLALDEGSRVLDVGCGAGGTTVDLARRNASWRLVGLDATPANLELAREHAKDARVDERVSFVECDYESPPLGPPERFAGAYAMESLCHAHDRPRVVREIARLLAPSAPFVVVDFVRTSAPLDPAASERYAHLRRGFAIADYYDEPLEAVFAGAGLRDVTTIDLTARVAGAVALSAARAKERLPSEPSDRMRRHRAACVALGELLRAGFLRYVSTRAVV